MDPIAIILRDEILYREDGTIPDRLLMLVEKAVKLLSLLNSFGVLPSKLLSPYLKFFEG